MKNLRYGLTVFIFVLILSAFWFIDRGEKEILCIREEKICEWKPSTWFFNYESKSKSKTEKFCPRADACITFDGINDRFKVYAESYYCKVVCSKKILARVVK